MAEMPGQLSRTRVFQISNLFHFVGFQVEPEIGTPDVSAERLVDEQSRPGPTGRDKAK
jgi:hypothetical protein